MFRLWCQHCNKVCFAVVHNVVTKSDKTVFAEFTCQTKGCEKRQTVDYVPRDMERK
jgi:hypothetical protein